MHNQKTKSYFQWSTELLSANQKVQYIAVFNICGELVYHYIRNQDVEFLEKELTEQFRKIAFATSNLIFENIKYMVLDKDNLKMVIINFNENNIIIGVERETTWSDLSEIINYFIHKPPHRNW